MKTPRRILSVLFALALVASPALAEETKAVKTVAGMLLTLNHFPNDANKATLKLLVDDKTTTPQELVLVGAVMNLQHTVGAADKPKVDALIADKTTTPAVRTLATVLSKFTHMATDADKTEMKKLLP